MIWKFISEKLNKGKKVVLLIVVKTDGSVPGKQGFKMAISSDGEQIGSIGGGIMEYELSTDIKNRFSADNFESYVTKISRNESEYSNTSDSYMGNQTIAIIPLSSSDIPTIDLIIRNIENSDDIKLLIENGEVQTVSADNSGILFENGEDDWIYTETLRPKNKATIIGAGYVGQAVAGLLKAIDFQVVLIDNRKDFHLMENNATADEKYVVDYDEIEKYIEPGSRSYVIIMTNKHQYDKDVMAKLLRLDLKYLGLMGSIKKISKFKEQLLEEGFTKDDFKKLHSPIGINIGSITPEEIAISIAAEIVRVKNGE